MTEKNKRFADEYLIDLDCVRAYKVAYPNVKKNVTASKLASRLLKNKEVRAYIDEQLEKLHNERTADTQEILEYLTAVLRGETKSEVLALSGDGVQEVIEKGPDEKERTKAAELLGKRYGMFKENVEMNADMNLNIKIDYGENDK